MKYNDEKDEYTLASGRKFYANCGILGLGPDPDDRMSQGYDGDCDRDRSPYSDANKAAQFTAAERLEIATEMATRWASWATRVEA